MIEVRVFPSAASSENLLEQLQQDLSTEVGPTNLVEGESIQHAKGVPVPEMVGLAVTLLTTPAVLKLIDLLRQYLLRDQSLEFIFEADGRMFHLKSSDLSSREFEGLVTKLTQTASEK